MDRSRMNQMSLNDFDGVWNNFRDSDESTKAHLCRRYALLKWNLFTELRNLGDLEEAIEKARWAVTGSDERWLLILGGFLGKRYECNRDPQSMHAHSQCTPHFYSTTRT